MKLITTADIVISVCQVFVQSNLFTEIHHQNDLEVSVFNGRFVATKIPKVFQSNFSNYKIICDFHIL